MEVALEIQNVARTMNTVPQVSFVPLGSPWGMLSRDNVPKSDILHESWSMSMHEGLINQGAPWLDFVDPRTIVVPIYCPLDTGMLLEREAQEIMRPENVFTTE